MRENQIYTSSQYDQFKFKDANREIIKQHVDEIAAKMKEGGWNGAPMQVSVAEDGKWQIEEGQHRYLAAKQTNTPIRFMIVKERSVREVAQLNSMAKGWTNQDYVHAYAADGNYNYKRIENLVKEFPNVSISDIMMMLGRGKGKEFKNGYTRLTDEEFYLARENLGYLQTMSESLKNIKVKTRTNYVRCLVTLLRHKLIEPQRMINKIDSYGRMLLPEAASRTQAYVEFEKLYNYHQQKNVVYFGDAIKKLK